MPFCLCFFLSVSDSDVLCSQIASNEPPPPGCSAFFSVHGAKTCDAEALASLLETAAKRSLPGRNATQFQGTLRPVTSDSSSYHFSCRPKPYLFSGDHRYSGSNLDAPVVILYAEFGTPDFQRLHQVLLTKVQEGSATYVLRHYQAVS